MTTIAEKARALVGSKPKGPPTAAQIANRIPVQEAAVAEQERRHAEIALAYLGYEDGADGALAECERQLEAARRELRALRAALGAATEREALEEQQRAAALHATQINAIAQHLAARDKAADELSVAIENAASAYRKLVERSEKARAACPIGSTWPMGSFCDGSALRNAIRHELFRVGHGEPGSNGTGYPSAFPGAKPPTISAQPNSVTPLVELVQTASRHVLDTLKGRKRPAPVEMPQQNDGDSPEPADVRPPIEIRETAARQGGTFDARGYVPTKVRLAP